MMKRFAPLGSRFPVIVLALSASALTPALEARATPPDPVPVAYEGPRTIPNPSLLLAPRTNAKEDEALWESPSYWNARKEWEARRVSPFEPPQVLRSISEAVYQERLRSRKALGPMATGPEWRSLGPTNAGGRVRSFSFTKDGKSLYVATANGGIWRLTRKDGAVPDWGDPVNLTDDLPLLTFGAVAVAPSDSRIVYAATGEQNPSGSSRVDGLGTIRSTDSGTTWSFNTESVKGGVSSTIPSTMSFALDVHPTNPDDVILASNDGIFRSTDGGRSWVCKLEAKAGKDKRNPRRATSLARRSDDAKVIWAGLWGGLAKSVDFGESWDVFYEDVAKRLGFDGFPDRTILAMSPTKPDYLYWLVSGQKKDDSYSQLGLLMSDNGGANWQTVLGPPKGDAYPDVTGDQGWAFLSLAVDPKDPKRIFAGGLDVWRSDNAGVTWTQISDWELSSDHPQYCHADINVLAFGPDLWVGSDGGVYLSTNGGRSFVPKNDGIVTRLFSSLAQHPTDPYLLIAGTQDNGTMKLRGASPAAWTEIFYGDGYDCVIDPRDPSIVFATNYSGHTARATDGGRGIESFSSVTCGPGQKEKDCYVPMVASFRTRLTMDPSSSKVLYVATDRLYKATSGATDPSDWKPATPLYLCEDGPTADPCSKREKAIADTNAIAVHPKDSGRVAVGMSSGFLLFTLDGQSWESVQFGDSIAALAWDGADRNALYVGLERTGTAPGKTDKRILWHLAGLDRKVRTSTPRADGLGVTIPYVGGPLEYDPPIDSLAVSPLDSKLLFAGTKYGIFRSTDGGAKWLRFGDRFPAAWVSALLFTPDGTRLRAATWGRGMWETEPAGAPLPPPPPLSADFALFPTVPRPYRAATLEDASQGGATSWRWDFGDGTGSTAQNAKKAWAKPGTYDVTLTVSNGTATATAKKSVKVWSGDTGTGAVLTYLIPAVLTSAGAGGTHYTTELTLTNRSGKSVAVTFTATGTFEGVSRFTMPAGQRIVPDAFAFLAAETGMTIPPGDQNVSLRIGVEGLADLVDFGARVRVTTPVPDDVRAAGLAGRLGLAYPAFPLTHAVNGRAYVLGLQQTSFVGSPGARSNLACGHAGGGTGGPVTLEVSYFDGETGKSHKDVDTFTLDPFRWTQRNQPLASRDIRGGGAEIKRTKGDAQFACYGVVNDNVNGDGSYLAMVPADVELKTGFAVVPLIVEADDTVSEVTLTNLTNVRTSAQFLLYLAGDPYPEFGKLDLPAESQFTIPNIVAELRRLGYGAPAGTQATLVLHYVLAKRNTQSDTERDASATTAAMSVRTQRTVARGKVGYAYDQVVKGEAAEAEAWVDGLQQTGTPGAEGGTRSSLSIVHAMGGPVDDLDLEVAYFGPDGKELGKEPACSPCRLTPGERKSFETPLARYGVAHGWARVRRVAGTDQFFAYGVLVDQASGDGSYLEMAAP